MNSDLPRTGAVTSGDTLYIATVGPDRSGRLRLLRARSGEIVLRDRDQLSVKVFTTFLLEFLQSRKIEHLVYAASPAAGPQTAKFNSYKIEGVLQLLPCSLTLVHSSALTAFMNRSDVSAPGPDTERLGRHAANMQRRAIHAALYQPTVAAASADRVDKATRDRPVAAAAPANKVDKPARDQVRSAAAPRAGRASVHKPRAAIEGRSMEELGDLMESLYVQSTPVRS